MLAYISLKPWFEWYPKGSLLPVGVGELRRKLRSMNVAFDDLLASAELFWGRLEYF